MEPLPSVDDRKYLNVDVSLQIEDREGARSSATKKTVRFYTAGNCGY